MLFISFPNFTGEKLSSQVRGVMTKLENNPFSSPPNHPTTTATSSSSLLKPSKLFPSKASFISYISTKPIFPCSIKPKPTNCLQSQTQTLHPHTSLLLFVAFKFLNFPFVSLVSLQNNGVGRRCSGREPSDPVEVLEEGRSEIHLGRSDGGLGLIGERVLIGRWVKSSREQRKDLPPPLEVAVTKTDVTSVEIFQSRIPLSRTIMKALTESHNLIQGKLEAGPAKPLPPSFAYLQVVVEYSVTPLGQLTPMGTSILTEGVLGQTSVTGKQVIELKVERILHVGTIDHAKYPLAKTGVPLDILRGYSHLRPRTTMII